MTASTASTATTPVVTPDAAAELVDIAESLRSYDSTTDLGWPVDMAAVLDRIAGNDNATGGAS